MKIALIGLGMVAKTHVAAIQSSKAGLILHGVLGRNLDRTADFAKAHDTHAYDNIDQIADDKAIDFVILATPPNARMEIVEKLEAAGKPILMEKPIERDLDAATKIVDLCESAHLPLGIVLQHRARQASQKLKSLIDTGALGEIATVDLRVPWWREQSYYDVQGRGTFERDGGGVMISQAIHTLDLTLWLLGPIKELQAMMRTTPLHKLEAEDWAGALFEMQSGAIGSLMATTSAFPGDAETITLQGSKASAHLGSGVLRVSYLDGRVETHGAEELTGGGADPMAFTHAWHQSIIEDFAVAISTSREPLASGRSALHAHAVIDAMQTAARNGSTVTLNSL